MYYFNYLSYICCIQIGHATNRQTIIKGKICDNIIVDQMVIYTKLSVWKTNKVYCNNIDLRIYQINDNGKSSSSMCPDFTGTLKFVLSVMKISSCASTNRIHFRSLAKQNKSSIYRKFYGRFLKMTIYANFANSYHFWRW
jgi:hypothetical protein